MSLDDIWSEPLAEEPIVRSREKQPLFLPGDTDDEEVQEIPGPHPGRESTLAPQALSITEVTETGGTNPDKERLDAIFADVDGEDLFADADKPIDLESMRRRAQEKIAATQSSNQSTAKEKATDGSQPLSKKDDHTQRRPVPKLDEERLLGSDGFPRLLKEYKNFHVSGKGREAQDLERLFRMYHAWTHRLFPKYKFRDTVERVEKLCRSRRMAVNLRVWRDDAHGVTRSQQPEDEDESGSELEANQTNATRTRSSPSRAQSEASSSRAVSPVSRARSESAAPSVPSSATDINDMDLDAILREEEELMQELNGDAATSTRYQTATTTMFDDEEALWAAAGGAPAAPELNHGHLSTSLGIADDDEMWDIVDEIQKSSTVQNESLALPNSKPSVHSPPPENDVGPTLGGEWDDMYE